MTFRAQAVRGLFVGAAAIALSTPVFAQTQEEAQAQAVNQQTEPAQGDLIIVTATKRASTVQDVPFSINAQTQEDIQRANANTIEDISRNVAGLAVQNLGPGQSQVSIRGVSAGQIVRDQPGVKEQVGVYLDESVISLSLFTPDIDLFDLNRVETLRGPQGTLFGSGSVGGTIRYITNQPDVDNFEGSVEGNYNVLQDGDDGGHLKGMINIPIVPGAVALRITGYGTEYGGFIDALREGGGVTEDVNSGSREGFRAPGVVVPEAESFLGEIDPPAHTQLRNLMRQAFRPGLERTAEPFARRYARAKLAALEAAGGGDLVATLGIHLPPAVTAHMLGIPTGEIERVGRWGFELLHSSWPATNRTERGEGLAGAFPEFASFLDEQIAWRRRSTRQSTNRSAKWQSQYGWQ